MNACAAVRDLLPLYALGVLPAIEADRCADHLRHCGSCQIEEGETRELGRSLRSLAPERTPPADVRDRVMERIAKLSPPSAAPALPTFIFQAASEGWTPTDVPGVSKRVLYADPAADRQTVLFRMAPGTAYPSHRHASVEECWVIEGDLWTDHIPMGPGDYQRAAAGSVHPSQETRGGCLLLISCSLGDERI